MVCFGSLWASIIIPWKTSEEVDGEERKSNLYEGTWNDLLVVMEKNFKESKIQ